MAERNVKCPSGLEGVVRGLKVEQLNVFGDQRKIRSGEWVDDVLRWSWARTTDAGMYPELYAAVDGKVEWRKVLQADRFYAMLMARVAYRGETYDFNAVCPRGDGGCGNPIEWTINLATDLEVKPVPRESVVRHFAGELFDGEAGGRKLRFGLLDGDGERRVAKLVEESNDKVTAGLVARVKSVDGVSDVRAWVAQLDAEEAFLLRDQFEAVDGGVETEVRVECQKCGNQPRVELPLGGRGFWVPEKKKR